MAGESRRLFIGLPVDDRNIARALKTELNSPGLYMNNLKLVEDNNFHITIKFLGDVLSDRAEKMVGSFNRIELPTGEIPFTLKGLGCFPGFANPSIIWAGLDCEIKKLLEIQRLVEYWSSTFGYERDKRRFTPHLTIARVRRNYIPEEGFKSFLKKSGDTVFGHSSFRECVLYESFLSSSGAVYEKLASLSLG